jgi:hypothetical protein
LLLLLIYGSFIPMERASEETTNTQNTHANLSMDSQGKLR